jgi:hypothetical protein
MTLTELETYFNNQTLPKQVKLSQCETIIDMDKFIKSHISVLKANSGNCAYLPFWDRLNKLHELLTKK